MPRTLRSDFKQTLKGKLKTTLIEGAHRMGACNVLAHRYGGPGVVLTFHEITADKTDRLGQGCTIADFETTLDRIAKSGRDFVSLEEAQRRLAQDGKNAKPFVALTFDDGYRDNVELALPVMERFGAPATIFVPTEMATREINAWWLAIRELVSIHDEVDLEPLGEVFGCNTIEEKSALYWHMIAWIWEDFRRAGDFAVTFAKYNIDMPDLVARFAMDAMEVQAADRHDLLSVQAHTVSHRALATLRDDEVLKEMTSNKIWLEDLLERQVNHFAYPYGRPAIGGEREAAIAKKAGFSLAVTTDPGTLFAQHGNNDNSFLWPRENGEFATSIAAGLNWSMCGTWRAARSRFGNPIANVSRENLSLEAAE